ncbi:hypothetical protein CRG98_028529 [Punica granatum]|uniref:Uncharacterized protein n=1 Tax=Punica granatum TaxID=22663 RepID=A0A2I0J5A7_PUNGR|nr:hypothetical protein CRG98_028529 [Punica granatum]
MGHNCPLIGYPRAKIPDIPLRGSNHNSLEMVKPSLTKSEQKSPSRLQMQSLYDIRMIRVQSRWAYRTNNRTARALSGKSRYAHTWLTGAPGGLVSRPPRTGPTCIVKDHRYYKPQELRRTLIFDPSGYVDALLRGSSPSSNDQGILSEAVASVRDQSSKNQGPRGYARHHHQTSTSDTRRFASHNHHCITPA